jgi:hypothetical protein
MTKLILFILSIALFSCTPEMRNLHNPTDYNYDVEDSWGVPVYKKGNVLSDFSYDEIWTEDKPVLGVYYMEIVKHNDRVYAIVSGNRGDEFSLYMIELKHVCRTPLELNSIHHHLNHGQLWSKRP